MRVVYYTAVGILAASLLFLSIHARSTAAENATISAADAPKLPPPGSPELLMESFYTGHVGRAGTFPGTLICIRLDRAAAPPADVEECPAEDRVYALAMSEGAMVHPLLAGNQTVFNQLDQMRGRSVIVQGKYYPTLGTIVAGGIQPKPTR